MRNYIDLRNALENLRGEVIELASNPNGESSANISLDCDDAETNEDKDLIITHTEINHLHGVGILLNQLFDPKTSINIHSRPDFDHEKGPFESYLVDAKGESRSKVFSLLLKLLAKKNIRRIICVPYYEEVYELGIVAKSIFNVPLVVWVMDEFPVDAKIVSGLFSLAEIRFVISPEMRDLYEKKFQQKFYVLPPTVKATLVGQFPQSDISQNLDKKVCVMIGNIWSQSWLENLCRMVKKSGWTVHWYGSGSASPWLSTSTKKLSDYGIIEKGYLPQKELAEQIKTYPFAIMPTGSGGKDDENKEIAVLSLPSRIIFLLAATHIPILVVGSEKNCASKFVRRFGIGLTTDYEEQAFLAALEKLSDKKFRVQCSQQGAKHAKTFSDEGLEKWIWESGKKGLVGDDRFEKVFQKEPGNFSVYREEGIPRDLDITESLQPAYISLRRLAKWGYRPDFIIDVGASNGVWSIMAQKIFPQARFILVEPLMNVYPQYLHQNYPQFECISAAASNEIGKTAFQVSRDLFGSSLLQPEDNRTYLPVEVVTTTLDTVRAEKVICGRGLLKIDVQFAEHLVLEGASNLLKQVDVVILELTLRNGPPSSKNFIEMIDLMESLGFHYFDDAGEWRCPISGILHQKDVLFVSQRIISREK